MIGKSWYNIARNLRYTMYLRQMHISRKNLLILSSPGRSGTHYVRFLFANYLKLVSGTADGAVAFDEMDAMLPNTWEHAYLGRQDYQKPTPLLKRLGIDDMARTHAPYQPRYWGQSRVLYLYRNPLDQAVSQYRYAYENRGLKETISGPVDVLDRELDGNVTTFLAYREAARTGKASLLRMSYEDLITYPETCLRVMLRCLGNEADPSLVETAVRYSSKESIMNAGSGNRPQHDGGDRFVSEFDFDGPIGQWKEYFTGTDLDRIQARLNRSGISLDEFGIET